MILYCVRHAESVYNSEGRIQGQADPPLSEYGEQQAQALGEAFRGAKVNAVFSSPLRRAYDTATPIAEAVGLPIQSDDRLKELNAGIFQGKQWDEIATTFPREAALWKSHDPDFRIPNGESRRELMQRGYAALQAIKAQDLPCVILVAHGGTLSAALKALLEIPAQRNPFQLFNGSISRLDWKDEVRLATLNQIEHLKQAGLMSRAGDL